MKVGAALPPASPAQPASPPRQPGRPFADFLADPATRAAGFAELGMFGLNQAQAAPAPARQREAAAPGAPPPARPAPAPAASGLMSCLAIGESPAEAPSPASPERTICTLPRAAPAKAETQKTCALPGEAADPLQPVEEAAGPDGPARAARIRLRQAALKSGVSLVLHEENGAVQIVAGGAPLDPDSRAQLRRLAAAMLAPAGLRLSQFQLNGAPIAPDSLGRTGGKNGTRSG